MTWDLTMAVVGQQYVVHIVLESTHGGIISNTAIDLIVEIVTPPPPTCAGSAAYVIDPGTPLVASTGLSRNRGGLTGGPTKSYTKSMASPSKRSRLLKA